MSRHVTLAGAACVTLIWACSSSDAPAYDPEIPTSWAAAVDNQYFPLVPGTTYRYEGAAAGGEVEVNTVEVLTRTRVVNGVTATVVRDQVFVDGELVEDTEDWYAQAPDGNVWYLGEDVRDYENGVLVSTAGSFEWGVNGALPGIIMYADPGAYLNEEYRQEYSKGVAEDFGRVIATGVSLTVPCGSFTGCIRTSDRNGLEPGVTEGKAYCPGIGNVLSEETQGGAGKDRVGVPGHHNGPWRSPQAGGG